MQRRSAVVVALFFASWTWSVGGCGPDTSADADGGRVVDGGGGDDGGVDGGADAGVVTRACTPDPVLVAAGSACQTDDHCPCGTHCDLGRCAAACTGDADCAEGELCDAYGRCRLPEDADRIDAPAASGAGRVALPSAELALPTEGTTTLTVRVSDAEVGRARVTAAHGAEVRCPDVADFGDQCLLSGLGAGDEAEVEVRRSADAAPEDVPEVTVHGPANDATVSLPAPSQRPGYVPADVRAAPVALQGRYRGTLRLMGAGTDADLDHLPPAAFQTPLAVTATVWEDAGGGTILAVDDPAAALTSAPRFVGTLALGADDDGDGIVDGSAAFPAAPFLETVVGGRTSRLVAETVSAPARSVTNPRSLSLVLTERYVGSGSAAVPAVRWALDLRRVGDAAGEAPAVPAAAAVGYDAAARLDGQTPWEAAFLSSNTIFEGAWDAAAEAQYLADWLMGYEPGVAGLCAPDAFGENLAGAVLLGRIAERWYLPDVTLQTSSTEMPFDALAREAFAAQPGSAGAGARLTVADPQWGGGAPGVWGLPCGFQDVQAQLQMSYPGLPGPIATVASRSAVDFCAQLEARMGCTPEDVSAPVSVTGTASSTGDLTGAGTYVFSSQIVRVCRTPTVLPDCAEQVACLSPAPDAGREGFLGAGFQPSPLPQVGDLACANGPRSGGFAIDAAAAASDPSLHPTAAAMFTDCLADAARLPDAPPTPAGLWGPGFTSLYPDARCVDVGRLLTALGLQTHDLRPSAVRLSSEAERYATAYTQRLLSRWLALHAFFASESTQREQVADVLRLDPRPGDPATTELLDAARASIHGWDLLVEPEVLGALMVTPGDALVEPDYRLHRFGLGGNPADEQHQPLATVILDTLVRQSGLLGRYLEKQGTGAPPDGISPLAAFMPRMLVAQAVALDMERRAQAAEPNLAWRGDFARKAERFGVKVADTLRLRERLDDGMNPLGIEDADLPLYFTADDATGAGGRFAAVSDFLLGDGPGSTAWAPAMVSLALSNLDDARQAYIDQQDRRAREARSDRDLARWVEDVRDDYNATLRDYCGPIEFSLIDDPNFDAASCALNRSNPDCNVDFQDWYGRWSEEDLMGRLCLDRQISQIDLSGKSGFADPAVHTFAEQCLTGLPEPSGVVATGACASDPGRTCLKCVADPSVQEVPLTGSSLDLAMPTESEILSGDSSADAQWRRALDTCRDRYPTMKLYVPLPKNPFEVPGCVRGGLGEAYLDVVSATRDVEAARAALGEHNEAYDIAVKSCLILQDTNAKLEQARADHAKNMQGLRIARGVADSVAAVAGAAKDCFANVADSDKSNPLSAAVSTASAGAACAAGGVEAASTIVSTALDNEMERAQQAHDDMEANLEGETEVQVCLNDAKQELVGMKTASIELEQAVFDLQRAQATVIEEVSDAQRVHADGYAYLQQIGDWPVPSPAGDLWVNEKIRRYARNFRLARRATYLAVRAVEYEFQASLGARQDVIDAKVPSDLEAVLQSLWTTSGTRSIAGSRPSELTVVLSLRDDILRLGDESAWPESMRPMTPTQRLQVLLASDRYAEYDESGRYLGQRIPFTLAPLGALGFESRGVSIYAQTDCAERLWSVNASILGDGVYQGSDTSFTRIDLLKRNTFFSQWCVDPPQGADPFQLATVRPTRNLFREPGLGASVGTDTGTAQGAEAYSRARIEAFFNVDRAGLEDPQYAAGQTSELAARGLYGDYALFVPAELISRGGSPGLELGRVDDILLRVDYLSVAAP